jgi:hypothetical protein
MSAQRILGFPALLFLAACATSRTIPRAELVPQNGPKARISASYGGGIAARTLRANFSVDKSAYVMVGHLAGDGRIRVLYPESALESNRVDAKKSYSIKSVQAQYDGAPQLFSFASRAYRSMSARQDSYDGRGNGFIFVIASAYPLEMSDLATDGVWDEYEVEDYSSTWDPRQSVSRLAQHVTRGVPYTLDYADSFTTHTYSSYATDIADCNILSSVLSGFMTSSSGLWGHAGFFGGPRRGWGQHSMLSWYFNRPAMYYTHGYGVFGSGMCDGYFGFGPRYRQMAMLQSPDPRQQATWTVSPALQPSDSPTTIDPFAPAMNWRGGIRPANPAAGTRTESALPSSPFAGIPARSQPPRSGRNSANRYTPRGAISTGAFDQGPQRAAVKPSHNGSSRNGSGDGPRPPAAAATSRTAPLAPPATRASTPSHSTPSSSPSASTEIVRPPGL